MRKRCNGIRCLKNTQLQSRRLPQGDEVECVLDRGALRLDGKEEPLCELELELKMGDPVHLFDFALALQQDIPMKIGNLSKAERGYALFAPQPFAAAKAAPLRLSRGVTAEQAFCVIAGNCMAQVQANEAGVALAHDMEGLHQMRVGLRRLRSALGLFRHVLQPPDDLRQELDWLGAQLGAARDWDVLANSTLPAVMEAVPDEARLADVKSAALGKAHEKHAIASSAVSSQRYTRLILSFTRWVQGRGWRDAMTPSGQGALVVQVTKFSRNTLANVRHRLLTRGKKLHTADPQVRHRVRIAAKKMRYAVEFFQSLYPPGKMRRYVEALSILQDELGRLNDAVVADHLLKELQDGKDHLEGGVGFARGYLASYVKSSGRKIDKSWKYFTITRHPC